MECEFFLLPCCFFSFLIILTSCFRTLVPQNPPERILCCLKDVDQRFRNTQIVKCRVGILSQLKVINISRYHYLTKHFTAAQPENPSILEFCSGQKRRLRYFLGLKNAETLGRAPLTEPDVKRERLLRE